MMTADKVSIVKVLLLPLCLWLSIWCSTASATLDYSVQLSSVGLSIDVQFSPDEFDGAAREYFLRPSGLVYDVAAVASQYRNELEHVRGRFILHLERDARGDGSLVISAAQDAERNDLESILMARFGFSGIPKAAIGEAICNIVSTVTADECPAEQSAFEAYVPVDPRPKFTSIAIQYGPSSGRPVGWLFLKQPNCVEDSWVRLAPAEAEAFDSMLKRMNW